MFGYQQGSPGGLFPHHNRGCLGAVLAAAPALADVGTAGLLADGGQLELPHLGLDLGVVLAHGDRGLQPGRQSQALLFALFATQLSLVVFPFEFRVFRILNKVLKVGSLGQTLANLLELFRIC